jgi:hypothetical protein
MSSTLNFQSLSYFGVSDSNSVIINQKVKMKEKTSKSDEAESIIADLRKQLGFRNN